VPQSPLYGLGGAGKTSVAVEYAYRHLGQVGVAWQFPAADSTVLAAEFGKLAAQLGARGFADARDPVASVHAVLARFPAPWLMVFDNAADMASVTAFLPPSGICPRGMTAGRCDDARAAPAHAGVFQFMLMKSEGRS